MTHEQKIEWMIQWCHKHKARLELEGECGFGRDCVGIIVGEVYPDYNWYDEENNYEEISGNGEVWTPKDAYHKHPCVAVLGRGEDAEYQLYDWLKWFDENGFKIETGFVNMTGAMDPILIIMGKHKYSRMVRTVTA